MLRLLINLAVLGVLLCGGASAQSSEGPAVPRAQPGDRVVLEIWNEEEMSDTFTINHNGYVALPRLGLRKVDSYPIELLEDSLRVDFAVYLKNPSVQISVLRRISVLGEVREPGVYMADLTMGIRELIALAGGPTPSGDPNRVSVMRDGERIPVARREDMLVTELLSGDQVVVGQQNFLVRNPWAALSAVVTIVGLVRQLGIF